MYAFDVVSPRTVAEAVAALAAEEAQALGGGQTLIPALKQRLAMPTVLVSLSGIAELRGISTSGSTVTIGGGTCHAEVARGVAEAFPALGQLAGQIGDPAVRNRGTIGGSLANNDPSACYPAAALACGAVIVTDRREIAAEAFFQGLFATALEEGEIITSVRFPVPEVAAYVKLRQPASRFALTAVFLARFADGTRIAVTGASGDGVFRWAEAEAALSDRFETAALAGLALDPDGMIADLHGSSEYRAHLVKVLTARAVDQVR